MVDTTQIKEGMTVYTPDNEKLGTVEYVQYGDEDPGHPGIETVTSGHMDSGSPSIIRAFARGLTGDEHLPAEIRANLMRYGYFRLKTGNLFESDYFVPFNLVQDVVGENIHIEATKDNLITA